MDMKLNNRGYVLVEIILASVIAFGIAYYMLDLTIKLKNKNDDLLANTLVMTDQAIIQNKLVQYMNLDGYDFNCDNIEISDKVISYTDKDGAEHIIDIVNKYTTVEGGRTDFCSVDENNIVHILLPLKIEAINEIFDVKLDYVLR